MRFYLCFSGKQSNATIGYVRLFTLFLVFAISTIGYAAEPLLDAARAGYPIEVKNLLDAGADINGQDVRGFTALHHAVAEAQIEVVKLLLDRGAKPEILTKEGRTALHIAAGRGRPKIAQLLLQGDGQSAYWIVDNNGETPLCLAAARGWRDTVNVLAFGGDGAYSEESGAEKPAECNPIQRALDGGHFASAGLLLERDYPLPNNAVVTAVQRNDRKSLEFLVSKKIPVPSEAPLVALKRNDRDLFAHLLNNQAPIDSALLQAVLVTNDRDLLTILLKSRAPITYDAWDFVMQRSDLSLVGQFLDRKPEIDFHVLQAFLGKNDLRFRKRLRESEAMLTSDAAVLAIERDDREMIDLYLKQKPSIRDDVLTIAIKSNDPALLRRLFERGSTVDVSSLRQHTNDHDDRVLKLALASSIAFDFRTMAEPRAWRVQQKSEGIPMENPTQWHGDISPPLEFIRLLVKADHNPKSNAAVLLHNLAQVGATDLIEYLLDRGAQINIRDDYGNIPLHWAAEVGDLQMVKFLLQRGADVKAVSDWSNTALHRAVPGNNLDVARLLIARGVAINARNGLGNTALHLAANYDLKTMVKLLIDNGADPTAKNDNNDVPTGVASLRKQPAAPDQMKKKSTSSKKSKNAQHPIQ